MLIDGFIQKKKDIGEETQVLDGTELKARV